MNQILKNIFIISCALAFLACNRGVRGNQNLPLPQDVGVANRQVEGTATGDGLHYITLPSFGDSENVEMTAKDHHQTIGMTLIPSVAPELLRNVMPNSWRKLTRLTDAEEQIFIKENAIVLSKIEGQMHNEPMGWADENSYEYFSIFRQQAGNDTFYRVIVTADNTPDFLSRGIRFIHILVHQNALLVSTQYNRIGPHQHGLTTSFGSIDIIRGKEGARGILTTVVAVNVDDYNPHDWSISASRRNGRLYGHTTSVYYIMSDLPNGNRLPIRISTSNSLVDPDIPLRYSLQNAFDGDSSTIFATNPEYGQPTMYLLFDNSEGITRMAVINGHAKDLYHYRSHNRIKKLGVETLLLNEEQRRWFPETDREIVLYDDYLDYQIFDVNSPFRISVLSVYNGKTYNNTFLSGLNLYVDGFGWLFGGIDE